MHFNTRQWTQLIVDNLMLDSPDSLSSRSLRYLGAEVEHLNLEDLGDVWLLSDRHRRPQQLEGDDDGNVLEQRHSVRCFLRDESEGSSR